MTCHLSHDMAFCAGDFPPFLASLFLTDYTSTSEAKLALPAKLDGSCGRNRASGSVANNAQNDLEALSGWLVRFSSNEKTFACYRREAERLLLWAILNRAKPLSSLTHSDLTCYQSFLTDPQPKELWIATHGMRVGRTQDNWRPFAGPLSEGSARQSLAILSRLFSWLVDTGYLVANPLTKQSRATPLSSTLAVTLMHENLLEVVTNAIDSLPSFTKKEKEHLERVRWLFSLLYFGGLSIAEIANSSMGMFYVRRQGESAEWWIDLTGNNGRRRHNLVSLELMSALIRYRLVQGLSAFPEVNEITPLVLPIGGRKQALGTRALYGIMKTLLLTASRIASEKRTKEKYAVDASWIAGGSHESGS